MGGMAEEYFLLGINLQQTGTLNLAFVKPSLESRREQVPRITPLRGSADAPNGIRTRVGVTMRFSETCGLSSSGKTEESKNM